MRYAIKPLLPNKSRGLPRVYESPVPRSRDRDVAECRQLYEMGDLTDAELAKLLPRWRHEYDRRA